MWHAHGLNSSRAAWLRCLLIITLLALGPASAARRGDVLTVRTDAPERYVVQRGDTLWGISSRFLNDPWRWPELWRMNRAGIKNPHLIYPGNVVAMRLGADGKPMLVLEHGNPVVKLSPRVRASALEAGAVPSISPSDIGPFLTRPMVIDEKLLADSPVIVATEENKVIVGAGNLAYVEGIPNESQTEWQIYRPGDPLRDPDTRKIIAYEAVHLGEALVTRPGNPATIQIVRSKMEINRRDRLVPASEELIFAYVPHAPDRAVTARIISAYQAVAELGQGQIVVLNRGAVDGLERGHVLATYRHGETVKSILKERGRWVNNAETLKLPDERIGLLFVFRTFDRVSYALVMNSTSPLHVGDDVRNPD